MKNKFRFLMLATGILMLAVCMASAQELILADVDETALGSGIIKSGNTTFRITAQENVYFRNGGYTSSYKRIFVEDLSKIAALQKVINEMNQNLSLKQSEMLAINENLSRERNESIAMQTRLESLKKEIGILEIRKQEINSNLAGILSEKEEIESIITGNFALSPKQTSAMLIIFIILIAAIVAIEINAYLKPVSTAAEEKPEADRKETKKVSENEPASAGSVISENTTL